MAPKRASKDNKWFETFKKVMRVVRKIISTIIIIMLIVIIIGLIYGFIKVKPLVENAKTVAYEKMSTIDKNTFKRLSDTEIYDNQGNKIGEVNVSNYKYAELSDISKHIQDGYIAVEDNRFAVHNGIDYKGIARAAVALVKNKGKVTQGGSTITQQVLKNNVIGTEINKWDRKLLEFFLAPEFEKMFTKGDIMEFYCNSNFYQNNCYGVETASNYYFGKSAKDVTIAEAALLVGLSNNPSRYNPVKNPDKSLEKRHNVLIKMLESGKITIEEFEEADKEELKLVLDKENRIKETYQVSFALHCAALKIMELDDFEFKYTFNNEEKYKEYKNKYNEVYKMASDDVRSGGYKIYTSLDTNKQVKLQEIVDSELSKFQELADDGRYKMQGAATLVNNETSMVEAIIGGRGTDDEYNRGYQGFRQPGSSIKPIISYAPAFETGKVYPSLIMKDEPIEDGPKNAGGGYIGNISVRDAIARSTNTIAWKVLEEIGLSNGLSYLDKLKFSNLSYLDADNLSMSLGGFTYGATTFEMAKAYSTLVTDGIYNDVNCITKLEFQDGEIKFDISNGINKINVYTPDSAYMTLDCLKGVVEKSYGTGKSVKLNNVIIAGKTGTTNDKKDGWFCGATNKYSLAVWCGYDIPKEIDDMSGGKYPGAIFKEMISYLHKDMEPIDFEKPNTVLIENIDYKGNSTTKNTGKTDLFSSIAISKLEEERRIAEEKARKEREEQERQAEELKVSKIKSSITEFSLYSIDSKEDLVYYDNWYKELSSKIKTIKNESDKQLYLSELNTHYSTTNSMDYILEYREQIEAERKAKEEEEARIKREKAEAEAKAKLENIKQADDLMLSLQDYKNMSENDIKILKGQISAALERCKRYNEYTALKDKYDSIVNEIEKYNDTKVIDIDNIQNNAINIDKIEGTPKPIIMGNEGIKLN